MMTENAIIWRLVLSVFFGGLIGFERQMHRRTAGLRTNILVCMGSCLVMLVSQYIFEIYKNEVDVDPSRIAASIITGIGFLGAGAIIRERDKEVVRGLTTAACLWVVAGIGMAVGCGFYTAGLVTTALTLIVLFFLRYFEGMFINKDKDDNGGGDR
ncbi:MAG: MgtC/SapB family protein [Candidatus Omnitrophica bacterium]|jgi:putative Mg2+ transporter-C (MgtC) family protein|nr:MgtC/SapB family protein [Candidatus Omnitrophota bacterium]